MAELHELLAVETSLQKVASKLSKESINTLSKNSLFTGMVRDLNMFDANQENLNTHEEQQLTTTVDENLDYILPHIAAFWDAVLQKDMTNLGAVADLEIDGKVLATNVPATFLLGLEAKLSEFRKVLESIPTLAPGIKWEEDPDTKKGAFKTAIPEITFKTEKRMDYRIVVEPTEYHPADVREVSTVPSVGKYTTIRWSGMITPADKAERLTRLDRLLRAVKQARVRANKAKVVKGNIASTLFDYING